MSADPVPGNPGPVTHYATCPLCEATCGLEITTEGRAVRGIRGDELDVFSHGYLCPKGYSLIELDADPDRLRAPLLREGETWREVSWDAAFAEIARRLPPIAAEHGRDAIAVYLGNPNVHNLSGQLYNPVLLRALRTRNIYSASTLDQMPKHVACGALYGDLFSIPVPDIDNVNFLLMLGANPLDSNGSLMTAPDIRGRLRRLRNRGAELVVIDPRRTRTADLATEHYFIHPGTDAYFLFAMVYTLFDEQLLRIAPLSNHVSGVVEIEQLARDFAPETVSGICGVPSQTIRRLARKLALTQRAAVYGRIGTCTQEFGTLASWLIEVLNVLTGHLDRPGGSLFPRAAAGARNTSGSGGHGKGLRQSPLTSRVRGLPQVFGELPTATLADEILTPGDGRVRALITIAGNPALSAPNSEHVRDALGQLDFMVSVDSYLNETSRFANVILPPPSPFERAHYDLAFYQLSVRNIAHYSPAIFPRAVGAPDEWEILLRLTGIVSGMGANADVGVLDDMVAHQLIEREVQTAGSSVEGREPSNLLAVLAPRRGPERLLDLMLRVGPYGDAFGAKPDGLTLAALEEAPHGVDLGPLGPRLPEVLRTRSGTIELAHPVIVADVPRLLGAMHRPRSRFVLIGRREMRSNNSWMHNLHVLAKGPNLCTLWLNPDDAAELGVLDGAQVRITSSVGAVEAPVSITDAIMPGVVSLPHGFGHDQPGTRLQTAATRPGANVNALLGDVEIDPLSGNAIQNAVPVSIQRV